MLIVKLLESMVPSCILLLFVSCAPSNDRSNLAYVDFFNANCCFNEIYHHKGKYASFCDIIEYKNSFYVAFRVGENHVPTSAKDRKGFIKILKSQDGRTWHDELTIIDKKWDLRDPCFCQANDGHGLYLYYGLYDYDNHWPNPKSALSKLQISNNKLVEYKKTLVIDDITAKYWLWKIHSHKSTYYSIGYVDGKDVCPVLFESKDGQLFKKISEIPVNGNETDFLFCNDKIVAIIRSSENKSNSYYAESEYPYHEWSISKLEYMVESPELINILNNIYVTGRTIYGLSLFYVNLVEKEIDPIYNFFCYGDHYDKGYPGMLVYDGCLYTVYYGCNIKDNNTSIILSIIPFLQQ